ncbi:MAG TPA: hypothetical protein PK668_07120 [Myxococcota bacterium]|nr:hypothetical protein [Myxococcota bacterium]HRY92384.1 hypothetical protein [Myxococcota bacterium]HSA24536.1 hypothetical protein [Myxococcota bacterium]
MDGVGRLLDSKIIVVLLVGLGLIVAAKFMKRGRLTADQPGGLERLTWAAGLLVTLSGILIAFFRCDVVDVPKKDKKQLGDFSRDEAPGCSKPRDMKDFDNSKK